MNSLIVVLLPFLMQVESNNNNSAIGDNGDAFGCLQIHAICVRDVNRIIELKTGSKGWFTHEDAFDRKKAYTISSIYLDYYGKRYTRLTGKKANLEVLARIHNGGPDGWKKKVTLPYWKKVKSLLAKKAME